MSFSDMLNFPDLPEPLDLSSIDDRSSLSQSATSSPTNFFDGCLLSPASILPGSMATPDTSTGSESDETCAYTQLFRQYQRCEQELLKTQQELESLRYVLSSLIFSSTPDIVRRTTHKTVVESHSLLIATYIETTRTPRVEDRAPLPEPGSALVPHAPSGTAFPPPVTQIQGPSRPRRSWKEMKERKYSYTIPMTPGIGVSAR
jgi:hypothetical protein